MTATFGLIADTHGYLDPQVLSLFAGVEHIFHAGDIGSPRVILELETVAPVTAVLGNTDVDLGFRETEVVEVGGHKFLVHHIMDVSAPATAIAQRIEREHPEVVVFGHTHRPYSEQRGGALYLNPGYAGQPRFHLRRSAALLHAQSSGLRVEFLSLDK
jgi:hypothetical protein